MALHQQHSSHFRRIPSPDIHATPSFSPHPHCYSRTFSTSPRFQQPSASTSASPTAPPPSSSSAASAGPTIRRRSPSINSPSIPRNAKPNSKSKLQTRDRGPASTETTQTDFAALNVLGNTTTPSTSVDICAWDGFVLDSGLRIADGDGVVLIGGEAFVWRPWMGVEQVGVGGGALTGEGEGGGAKETTTKAKEPLVYGSSLKSGRTESERTGGVLNTKGQFEATDETWGIFKMLSPKPDLLIIGTGPQIRPLAPSTRKHLQSLGVRIEVLDTRNAASQFNMLATERGVQEVAAALVPIGFGANH